MLAELRLGYLARKRGCALRRTHVGYDLWSSKVGNFALRSCTLFDVQTFLFPPSAGQPPLKKKIKRVPLIGSRERVRLERLGR